MHEQDFSVSRRNFLKIALAGAGAAVLGGCATPTGTQAPTGSSDPEALQTVEVTFLTSGWPIQAEEWWSEEAIASDPVRQEYRDAMMVWMEQHPGVSIEPVEVNIWDQQAIVAAIAGGTAPTWTFPTSIGGSLAGARAAFKQGLMADVTPAVEAYDVLEKVQPSLLAIWQPENQVDGQFMSYPLDTGANDTVYYRRDLVQELGLEEPSYDWTWADFFDLAIALNSPADNRKGFGGGAGTAFSLLRGHGYDLLSQVPAPDTNWNWQRDLSNTLWPELLADYRNLIFQEEAVLSDAAADSAFYQDAFRSGSLGMIMGNILTAFGNANDPTSFANFARSLGKEFEEVIGLLPPPVGLNGFKHSGAYVAGVSFNPDHSPEEVTLAAGLVDHMFIGEGWLIRKAGQWELNQDLTAVFNYPYPIDGNLDYPGVPGTFEDAWGARTAEAAQAIYGRPVQPNIGIYLPAEENPGPDSQVFSDVWSTITYVADNVSPAEVLANAESVWNQQAQGFTSSVPDDVFVEGARQYFADVASFWESNAPDFYESTFEPWYNTQVVPALNT